MLYLFLADVAIGLLMLLLAVPMILQKVKPNPWYGFRTPKTLSDERIWYAANRYAGKVLLLAGLVTIAAAVALYSVAGRSSSSLPLSAPLLYALWLAVLMVPLSLSVLTSFIRLSELS